MKHYEVILKYDSFDSSDSFDCDDDSNNNNDKKKSSILENEDGIYKVTNYNDLIDKNEFAEFKEPIIVKDYSAFQNDHAIDNINSYLLSISTKEKSIFLTSFEKGYMVFISKTKNIKDLEEMIELSYRYIKDNIDKMVSNFALSSKPKYREISAKEFLIDNIDIYRDQKTERTDALINQYFSKLEEFDYKITEFSRRGYLSDRFVKSKYIGKTMSLDELKEKYKDLMYNKDLKDEIERIYNIKNGDKIKFNPFQYEVYTEDSLIRERIYECLGTALYNSKRINERNLLIFSIDLYNSRIENKSFKVLLNNSVDALVCFEFYQSVGNSEQVYNLSQDAFLKEFTDIIENFNDKIQFVFHFNKYQKIIKNRILENIHKIKLIKIKNNFDENSVDEYIEENLKNKGLTRDNDLNKLLKITGKKLTPTIINNVIEEWQKEKLVYKYFTQYKDLLISTEAKNKKKNSYEKLKSMVGLDNVKKIIDLIISNYQIEKLKRDKFVETKKSELIDSSYSPLYTPLNMAFMGNPGTCKSTVATLIVDIFYEKGIIRSKKIEYYNQSDSGIQKSFKKAYGGILFIDEAYQYINIPGFVANLIECMELYRNNVIVIIAGYRNEMEMFLSSNPGFESRVKYKIDFPDYTEEELWQILKNLASEQDLYIKDDIIKDKLMPLLRTAQVIPNLGNGRLMRNVLDAAIMNKSKRLSENMEKTKLLTYEQINTFVPEDFNINFKELTNVDVVNLQIAPDKELERLIGLSKTKEMIKKIISSSKISLLRKVKNGEDIDDKPIKVPMHLAFLGNPGTAKTTVARLFANILNQAGIIKNPVLVEVGRKDLVGEFVGHTAPKVKAIFDKAKGGVLFIDEAYSLVDEYKGGYGDEAINTIIQEMENRRDEVIVIFAGYTKNMAEFINKNEGMRSRINYIINFDDYNEDELLKIFKKCCEDDNIILPSKVEKYTKTQIKKLVDTGRIGVLGNGRLIRKIVEAAKLNMDYRLSKMNDNNLSKEILNTLCKSDVSEAIKNIAEDEKSCEKAKNNIGFKV